MIKNTELIKATIDRCTRTYKELINYQMVFRDDKRGLVDYRQIDDINVSVMNAEYILIIDHFAYQVLIKMKNMPSPQKKLCLVSNFDLDTIPMGLIQSGSNLALMDIIGSDAYAKLQAEKDVELIDMLHMRQDENKSVALCLDKKDNLVII